MKNIIITLFLLLLCNFFAAAQFKPTFALRGGLNIAFITPSQFSGMMPRISSVADINIGISNQKFSFSVGAGYNKSVSCSNEEITNNQGQLLGGYKFVYAFNYWSIPVSIKYNFLPKTSKHNVGIGGIFSLNQLRNETIHVAPRSDEKTASVTTGFYLPDTRPWSELDATGGFNQYQLMTGMRIFYAFEISNSFSLGISEFDTIYLTDLFTARKSKYFHHGNDITITYTLANRKK